MSLPIPQILRCTTCTSDNKQPGCFRCRGAEVVFLSDTITFVWRGPFTPAHFQEIHLKKMLHALVNGALGIMGFISFIVFVFFTVLPIAKSGSSPIGILSSSDWSAQLFWLSLLLDAWLISRIKRAHEKKVRVLSVKQEQLILDGKKNVRIDIDKALSHEALMSLGHAFALAYRFKHSKLTALHLFSVLFDEPTMRHIAGRIALDSTRLHDALTATLQTLPSDAKTLPLPTDDFYSLLMRAYRHAQDARKNTVDSVDLFTATIDHETRAHDIMEELGIPQQTIENVVAWFNEQKAFRQEFAEIQRVATLRPRADIDRAMTGRATPLINQLGNDLTRSAQYGHLFPPIGRDKELDSLLTTVASTTKNIVLVGEMGTGASTLIHGIAYAMVGEQVPDRLKDKRLVSISAGHLASTNNPVAAFQALLDEVLDSGNIILVINNLHDFTSQKGIANFDLAGILAETIERTGLMVFATSTPAEYHRFLENHLVSSVFQRFDILEPDENKTIQMVEAHISSLEQRFPVYFTYDAIATAVTLSKRYLHDTHNPKKSIDLCEQVAVSIEKPSKGVRVRVMPEDIERTLEHFTHAKVGSVGGDEKDILLHLEDTIHQHMIDQEPAVTAVANALRRARVQLRETKRPIAVFMFLGPTGVGKTELARTLASVYFGSEKNMVRLDMSEYQEITAIERLIGLTGSDVRGGTLTEPIRTQPFSLLLLDELEKANHDVLNLFLQVFEDGRLTDNTGEAIDFTNTIIITTSNAGSQYIQDAMRQGSAREEIKTRLLEQELRGIYTPEFLNRFDDIIVFQPLSEEHIQQIAQLMIGRVQKQMEAKGIAFDVTDAAIKELAHEGYDPQFGARPLRRVIQNRIEDVLAKIMLGEKIGRRDKIILDAGGTFTIQQEDHFLNS